MRGVYKEIAPTFKNRGRSIPTRVGFARSWGSGSLDRTVHPHVRGVYACTAAPFSITPSPSPRMWGLRTPLFRLGRQQRSIPTCVGFMDSGSDIIEPGAGPSPRAWGLRIPTVEYEVPQRSIPTCVGFTLSPALNSNPSLVHPHVRGVYRNRSSARSSFVGPSPRAWGLLSLDILEPLHQRSIPTCVGFT